ncbi:MAG: ABC transporter ATP-binding protein [Synergistaceae bacterium]|jgi:putative ABC transport system ATP-binding protein|nr:ABC transporter ATP-binding protein [Synergistaceae bacterium]
MIEAIVLKKEYKRGGEAFPAVNGVSFHIGRGEFVCITGRSGSGKSTLLNMLAGMMSPTSGDIVFHDRRYSPDGMVTEGRKYSSMTDRELSALRSAKIGYIMQGMCVFSNFTVLQNVSLPHFFNKFHSDPEGRARFLLEQVGIPHLARQYPTSLSGGEIRRVSVARALFNSPELLIADEPTSDLDGETASGIMNLFESIVNQGTSILMVTHNREEASHGSRRYEMNSGVLESARDA